MDVRMTRTCTIDGCESKLAAKGLCTMHYQRKAKGSDMTAPRKAWGTVQCTYPGCDHPHKGYGYCKVHLRRLRSGADMDAPIVTPSRHDPRMRDAVGRKICNRCGEWKAEDGFHRMSSGLDGLHTQCKVCAKEAHFRQKYGLTMSEYMGLIAEQGGSCAICGCRLSTTSIRGAHIDHDHSTGAVRGILCGNCNNGLGYFRDNPQVLRAAAGYLEGARK